MILDMPYLRTSGVCGFVVACSLSRESCRVPRRQRFQLLDDELPIPLFAARISFHTMFFHHCQHPISLWSTCSRLGASRKPRQPPATASTGSECVCLRATYNFLLFGLLIFSKQASRYICDLRNSAYYHEKCFSVPV